MYSSSTYGNLLGNSDPYSAKLVFGTTEIEDSIISVNCEYRFISEDHITIGGAVSGFVEVEMEQSALNVDGLEFALYFRLGVSDWIPMGKYKANKPKTLNGITTFSAYDSVYAKLNFGYFSDLIYPTDYKNVLNEISRQSGVPINTSSLPSGVIVNQRIVTEDQDLDEESGEEITVTKYVNPFDGYLYNEALGYIAQLYGRTAMSDRNGNIVLKAYTNVTHTIDGELYYDDLTVDDTEFSVGKIACGLEDGNILYSGSGSESIAFENPFMTQDRLDAIRTNLSTLKFYPSSLSMIGDARLDLGDVVNVTDKFGNTVKLPIMLIAHKYDGGIVTTLQSFGKPEQELAEGGSIAKGPLSQQLSRQQADMSMIKDVVANKVSVRYLEAVDARIDNLRADTIQANEVTANNINAINARIDDVVAENVTANRVVANRIEAVDAKVNTLDAKTVSANNVLTGRVEAVEGRFETLNTKYATIDMANVNNAWIENGVIKDASITDEKVLSVSANKLTAGTIDASKINVTNINADNLTVGTINGQRIGKNTIDLDKLSEEVPTKDYLDGLANNLQEQIDGSIQTYTVSAIPTLNNEPASSWKTNTEKDKHIGDLCYVTNAGNSANGYCYRFAKSGTTYAWTLIKDNDVTAALQRLLNAEGSISSLQTFKTETSKWIDETDESLRTTYVKNTALTTKFGDYVESADFSEKIEGVFENSSTITNLTQRVNNFQIGSRNYIRNAGDLSKWHRLTSVESSLSFNGREAKLGHGSVISWDYSINMYPKIPFELLKDKEVTISLYARVGANTTSTDNLNITFSRSSSPGKNATRTKYGTGLSVQVKNLTTSYVKISNTVKLTDSFFISGSFDGKDDLFFVQIYNHSLSDVWIKEVKLEAGNVPSDFSIAPEDLEDSISVVSNTVNTVKQTADQNTSSISSLTKTVAGNKTDIESKYSDLTQSLDGFKATVSATYSTITEAQGYANTAESNAKADTTNKLKAYSTTTQMNAAINQKANEISLTVSETYTTKEDFNNLEIGGRNLLANSKALTPKWGTIGTTSLTDGVYKLTQPSTATETRIYQFPTNSVWTWKPNTTYTASIDAKTVSGTGKLRIAPHGATGVSTKDFNITNEVKRYSYTFTTGDSINSTGSMAFYSVNASSVIEVSKPKLEEGNKATAWTPSPDDIENRIIAAEASIKVNADNISSKVSTDGLISEINQTAGGVKINAERINLNGYVTISNANDISNNLLIDADEPELDKVNASNNRYFSIGANSTYCSTSLIEAPSGTPGNCKTVAQFVWNGTQTSTLYREYSFYDGSGVPLIAGRTYEASCYIRCVGSITGSIKSNIRYGATASQAQYDRKSITTSWEQIKWTFVAPEIGGTTNYSDGSARLFFGTYATSGARGTVQICGCKLREVGDPNPSDTDLIKSDCLISGAVYGVTRLADSPKKEISLNGTFTYSTSRYIACYNLLKDSNFIKPPYIIKYETTNLPSDCSVYVTGDNMTERILSGSSGTFYISETTSLRYVGIKVNTANSLAFSNVKLKVSVYYYNKYSNMLDWASSSDTTQIDGGKIFTGSIKADALDVTDLKAFNATIGGWDINDDGMTTSNGDYIESFSYLDRTNSSGEKYINNYMLIKNGTIVIYQDGSTDGNWDFTLSQIRNKIQNHLYDIAVTPEVTILDGSTIALGAGSYLDYDSVGAYVGRFGADVTVGYSSDLPDSMYSELDPDGLRISGNGHTAEAIMDDTGRFLLNGDIWFNDWSNTRRKPVASVTENGYRIAYLRAGESGNTSRFIINGQFGSTSAFSNRYIATSSSDIRLKENVKDANVNALDLVNQIQIREFDWKDNGEHQKIGFVADELETLDPALTMGGGYDENGDMDVKAVDSFYLTGYLTKAIQELSDEVNRLKTELAELKNNKLC